MLTICAHKLWRNTPQALSLQSENGARFTKKHQESLHAFYRPTDTTRLHSRPRRHPHQIIYQPKTTRVKEDSCITINANKNENLDQYLMLDHKPLSDVIRTGETFDAIFSKRVNLTRLSL